jgi:hypothetical protein
MPFPEQKKIIKKLVEPLILSNNYRWHGNSSNSFVKQGKGRGGMALLLRSSSFQQQKRRIEKNVCSHVLCRTTNDNARKMTPFEMMIEFKTKKKGNFVLRIRNGWLSIVIPLGCYGRTTRAFRVQSGRCQYYGIGSGVIVDGWKGSARPALVFALRRRQHTQRAQRWTGWWRGRLC